MEVMPIPPRSSRQRSPREAAGVVFCATVGHATLATRLDQVTPLWRAIGRARAVWLDDGTLTGADRTRLARHCRDPEILLPGAVPRRGFPDGGEWARLLAALDGRASAYWVLFGGNGPLFAAAPDLARAVASNRSFAMLDPCNATESLADAAFPALPVSRDLVGLAAGGAGRPLAAAILARLTAELGEARAHRPEAAHTALNHVLGRETEPVLLPFTLRDAR